jgi:hypothetical protein
MTRGIYATSYGLRTCATRLKVANNIEIWWSRRDALREIMTYMAHTMINLLDIAPRQERARVGWDQVILMQYEKGDLTSQLQAVSDL